MLVRAAAVSQQVASMTSFDRDAVFERIHSDPMTPMFLVMCYTCSRREETQMTFMLVSSADASHYAHSGVPTLAMCTASHQGIAQLCQVFFFCRASMHKDSV